jgi:hypothetical protein
MGFSRCVSVDKSVQEESDDYEEHEMARISNLIESPLQSYARYLARLDMINPREADYLRMKYPVTKLFKADIIYARKTWKNRIIMINGATGTLKSFSAITISDWLDQNGFWTHNKGRYELPKLHYEYDDFIACAQTARPGSTVMLDEEADYQGTGSHSIQFALHNLERTVARFNELNFVFVYVAERSHQVNTLLYTRGEHYFVPPLAEYAGLGVLQPLASQEHYQLLGLMTVDVPKQAIIDAYHKKKVDFVGTMKDSGGYGEVRNLIKSNEGLIRQLASDKDFLKLTSHGARTDYVSYKFRKPKNQMDVLLRLVDFDYEAAE